MRMTAPLPNIGSEPILTPVGPAEAVGALKKVLKMSQTDSHPIEI